ncbi:MAG: hypothetical protein AAGD32_07120 [Planctomycetota bacterium]
MTQDPNYDPRHPGGFEPYANTNYGDQTMAAPKNSIAGIIALITGAVSLIPCLGLLTAPIALISGLIGFFTAGKPSVKGRWMAVVGVLLALVGGGYQVAIGGWLGNKGVAAVNAITEVEQGIRNGDLSTLAEYSDLSAAEIDAIQAEIDEIAPINGVVVSEGQQTQSPDGQTAYLPFVLTINGANGTKTVEVVVEMQVFTLGSGVKIGEINVE